MLAICCNCNCRTFTSVLRQAALGSCEQHWVSNVAAVGLGTHHLAQHTSASNMTTANPYPMDSPMGDVVGEGEPPLHASNVGHQSRQGC